MELTELEKSELTRESVSTVFKNLSQEQLDTRVEIAKKIFGQFFSQEGFGDLKTIYEEFPVWGFYKDRNDGLYRVYGACQKKTGEKSLFAVQSECNRPSILKIKNCDDLYKVDCWSDKDITHIKSSTTPGLFQDPLGFLWIIKWMEKNPPSTEDICRPGDEGPLGTSWTNVREACPASESS